MNIEMFMAQMNTEHKDAVIQKHITRQYVPLEEKIAEAKNIIETACYKDVVDSTGAIRKVFWADSVKQNFLTILAIIRMYTDLTFSDDTLKDYNMLAEKKIDEMILNALSDDVSEFTNIVDLIYDDEYENINSIQGRIKNLILGFEPMLQGAISKMVENQLSEENDNGSTEMDDRMETRESL